MYWYTSLTSCAGASRGFLNSASETGSENFANIEGRSFPGNCWENCSASAEYLVREREKVNQTKRDFKQIHFFF